MVFLTASHASARLIPVDDFNDGNDDGWTHMDSNVGQSWGPGIFDASSMNYQLMTTDRVPEHYSNGGFLLSLWDNSSDPLFSDGYVRARFRIDTFDGVAALLFRFSADIASGLNGYAFIGVAGGGFAFEPIVSTTIARKVAIPDLGPAVGEEWWMEAGGIGDWFSMKVWRVGEPEPESPQIVTTDQMFRHGFLGVDANISFGSPFGGVVNTTFDDIYFTPALVGDYNDDGTVDAADYTVWRDHLGARPGTLSNDVDGGVIGSAQYSTWKANYGMTNISSSPQHGAVPEPEALVLALTVVPGLVLLRRRASQTLAHEFKRLPRCSIQCYDRTT